ADQPAFLPGHPPPLGRRADLRLADALAAARTRLRAPHPQPRGHGLLGHHLHHDQAARPLREPPAARTALGRTAQTALPASGGDAGSMNSFINRLLGLVQSRDPGDAALCGLTDVSLRLSPDICKATLRGARTLA